MFDKFGEFDSCEELNAAAAGLLAEQNEEGRQGIIDLAEENGIDKEDAADYIDGMVSELANPLMAAYGKLDVEAKALQPYEIMEDWLQYIRVRCEESGEMAAAVRKKGKSLKGCIGALLKWSFNNQHEVDKDIVKAAGVNARCTLGIPGMGRAKKIITEYYLGGAENEEK